MATICIASNIFALIYIRLAQFLNCGIKATHSLNLDHFQGKKRGHICNTLNSRDFKKGNKLQLKNKKIGSL